MKSQLERFEDKHGSKDELILKYSEAAYGPNANPDEARRLNTLLQKIEQLIWYDMGYRIGFAAGKKDQSK